jgi:hypothetical protein
MVDILLSSGVRSVLSTGKPELADPLPHLQLLSKEVFREELTFRIVCCR